MAPLFFGILFRFVLIQSNESKTNVNLLLRSTISKHTEKSTGWDSSLSIRIINGSSLKRLPAVIKDLSVVLNESKFEDLLVSKNGFTVYLYDVTYNSFENSASVQYQVNDTMYHLELNRFNKLANDMALAATLIHEIMHCVLLDIYKRAIRQETKALATIQGFGLNKNDSSNFFNNDFFVLMNRGNDGQHELISRLFLPLMKILLDRFTELHKTASIEKRDVGFILWTGLQETGAYKKLSDEEKRTIELAIITAKGLGSDHD